MQFLPVSSTSQIAAPFDGQIVYNLTDNLCYQYHASASAWWKLTAYARYALTSGTTPLSPGGDTLLQFPTAIATDPRVVPGGGGNTNFTLTPGRWRISASLRTSANTSMTLYLGTGTTANEDNAFAGNSTNTFVNVGVSDTVEFTSSTTVCCFVWSSTNVNAISQGLSDLGVTHISFERLL